MKFAALILSLVCSSVLAAPPVGAAMSLEDTTPASTNPFFAGEQDQNLDPAEPDPGPVDSGGSEDSGGPSRSVVASQVLDGDLGRVEEAKDTGAGVPAVKSGYRPRIEPSVCGSPYEERVYDSDGELLWVRQRCNWWVVACGFERIDEARTGERAGGRGKGAYAEWLVSAHTAASPDFWMMGEYAPTAGDMGEAAVGNALGDSFGAEDTINFKYCRRNDTGNIILSGDWEPTFPHGSPVRENFAVDESRAGVRDALAKVIYGHYPDMQAIPPLSDGRIFVRFPSWFWLNDLVERDSVYAVSELGTIRISARATFTHVVWNFAGREWSCAAGDMKEWKGGNPTVDPPVCQEVFDKLGWHEMTATAFYFVEERMQLRPSASDPWPETVWSAHEDPIMQVSSSAGEIGIGPILALNTPLE